MTTDRARSIRFLFAMFQGGGNIPLIMPIVGELVARGHEVRILAGPGIRPRAMPVSDRFRDWILECGAAHIPLMEPRVSPYESAPPLRGLAFGWVPKHLARFANEQVRTTLWSPAWARNVRDELLVRPTDVVVADFFLPGAIAAAEAAGLPRAVIVHNAFPPDPNPPTLSASLPARTPWQRLRQAQAQWMRDRIRARDGLPAHNDARVELGLRPLRSVFDEFSRATRVLVLGYEAFDFPARLAANVRYVGTPIDDARPLVLVSLSTLSQGQAPTMHRILEAIGEMPVRALVTLGPSLNRDEFRAPENAVFETFVPHSAVLPHVAAAVTQCGLGTLTKALRHGVPLLCFPLVGDQPDNAARIVAHGAGLRLPADASSGMIRVALAKLLEEAHFREAAGRLGAIMRSGPSGEVMAADELEGVWLNGGRVI